MSGEPVFVSLTVFVSFPDVELDDEPQAASANNDAASRRISVYRFIVSSIISRFDANYYRQARLSMDLSDAQREMLLDAKLAVLRGEIVAQ